MFGCLYFQENKRNRPRLVKLSETGQKNAIKEIKDKVSHLEIHRVFTADIIK